MVPQSSHITKKRGLYYYRRRIPSTLSDEVVLSLRTRVFRQAEALAIGLDEEFRGLLDNVNRRTDVTDLKAVFRDYLKKRLDFDMARRAESPNVPMFGWSEPGMAPAEADLEWVDHELAVARSQLINRSYSQQGPLIDELMETYGVPEEYRNALAHGIFQANVEAWETIRRRTLGEFTPVRSVEPETVGSPATGKVSKQGSGPLLSEALPGFLAYAAKDEGWSGQTLAQNKTSYRMFEEVGGDKRVDEYERRDFTKFYDLLRALPVHYAKSKTWRGLTLSQIVERTKDTDIDRLTNQTVKRHFSALGSLYAYLIMRGDYIGANPAYGFKFPTKGRARDKRKMWQGEPLAKLFNSPVWVGCFSKDRRSRPGSLIIKDEKYWLPLLGLYHGNRLEEFAQLHRSDIRCEDGIWFMDINDEDDKQLKNEQSRRRVPLHPRIKELGFIDYVNQIAADKKDRIFPGLKPGGPDKKLGYFFTKWWTTYRKDVEVYEKGLDYHSFRGGVTTKLSAANISIDIRNELLGHEGQTIDQQNYIKGLPLRVLADAIAHVHWPEVQLVKTLSSDGLADVA
jgi:hypothetical protein